MISNDCDIIDVEISEISNEVNPSQRTFITARRRSLSGSAVATNPVNRKINFGLKNDKVKLKANGHANSLKSQHSQYVSADCIHSDVENTRDSTDSSIDYHKSNSLLFSNRTSVSAKTKIKHFLAEHIVKIHPCHHPEYHFHKKHSDVDISNDEMKIAEFHEIDFPEHNSYESSNSSSSKDMSNPRPKSAHENSMPNNYANMASTVLDRIRHMNIQSFNPASRISLDNAPPKMHSPRESVELSPNYHAHFNNSNQYFPSPEPNPGKLPKVLSPSSITFSSKLMASHKSKRHRLAHSVSLDPDYKLPDACKFFPEKDKWEKKISGYLDTSTPTGAALTAINFGLKRVTETDKYVMITKSPILSPNEFLEEGINHLQDSKALYRSLLQHTNCYDLMPYSGKIIIIDSQMQIGKAFDALEDNIIRASPIWNSEKQEFVALLTVNDLVPLLLHLHQLQRGEDHCCNGNDFDLEDFSTVTVEKVLNIIPRFRTMQGHIAGVSPETNLYSVTNMLSQMRKSKVIVLDASLSGNPLFLLTDLKILIYLTLKMQTMNVGSCFMSPIQSETLLSDYRLKIINSLTNEESLCEDLCISTFGKTQFVIFNHSSIIDVLRAMTKSYYTCALILSNDQIEQDETNSNFVVCDVITISDILHLVMINKHRDSTITVSQIIQYRNQNCPMTYRDPVVSCSVTESVQFLIDLVVKKKASFALIRSSESPNSPTIAMLTPIDILIYICKQSSNSIAFPNSSTILDLHKDKRSGMRYTLERFRQYSDGICSSKNSPKILDDTLEEVFNIDVT